MNTKTDQLLNLTRAMLATATADDWSAFELLESQRRRMLEIVVETQAIEESHVAATIKEIQLIDQDITRLIIEQRNQAAKELRQLRYANVGSNAYRSTINDSELLLSNK
jgi:hypothetical protein